MQRRLPHQIQVFALLLCLVRVSVSDCIDSPHRRRTPLRRPQHGLPPEERRDPQRLRLSNQRRVDGHRNPHKRDRALPCQRAWHHEPSQAEGVRGCSGGVRRKRRVVLGRGGLVAQPREPAEDFFVCGGKNIIRDGVCGPGEAAVSVQTGRQKVEVGGCFPARGADEGGGGEVRARGQVDGALRQAGDVGDVDAHGARADELEEIGWVVEDAEGRGDPERADPGLELGGLRVGVVAV